MASGGCSRKKVLIVDDTPENLHLLMDTLADDYSVIVASNGEQAIALARKRPVPDIILLDISMPDMDGYEVCTRLQSGDDTRSIPVIFITALSQPDDEKRGLDLGAVDYIVKPFSPGLVKARVRNHLELKQHRDQLADLVWERTLDLELAQEAAIFGLGILAEYRDPETGQHIRRTQLYIELLIGYLQDHPRFRDHLTDSRSRMLIHSAPLHDIGKVAIPDTILHKPGPLTADEFAEMKMHTIHGRDVVVRIEELMHHESASSFLRCAEEITLTHHERWDGTGYHGMRGEDIPVSGRLMALVDVYDALVSKRTYKEAYSHEQAFRIITEGDGRTMPEHFDPDVLGAFIALEAGFRTILQKYQE